MTIILAKYLYKSAKVFKNFCFSKFSLYGEISAYFDKFDEFGKFEQ